MKRIGSGSFILYFLFNCLALIPLNGNAQERVKPVRNTILLSGNFGELRATHFHSGIDIRTGGVEGLPVICVQEGQVVRVSVSPTGYGQALYIDHPDGTTTVYGHLQRFVPRIEKIVRTLQYQQESFRIDEDFKAYSLFFRQGDTIAYTGNTGSSGGPHLHFEIRNTLTEHTINPLRYYSIRDSKPPVIRKLYFYGIDDDGVVDPVRQVAVKAVAAGKYQTGQIAVPAGKIGIGVFVTDYMDDSWNKLGVYQMSLITGGDTLFALKMDSCSFDQGCFINEVKDFDGYKRKETVYRCFGNYQHEFLSISNYRNGCLEVAKDSLIKAYIIIEDINGNKSRVDLSLKGNGARKKRPESEEILRYNQKHVLEVSGCRVELEAGCLFSSIRKELSVEKDSASGRDIFVLASREVPLFQKARMVIPGHFDPRTIICELGAAGQRYPVETSWSAENLEAKIGCLGRYTIVEDTKAPEISFLGRFPNRTLRFRIKDDLSGVAVYRGEVNGKWCLFSYDPRINVLQCSLTEPGFIAGQENVIRIWVEDKVGNKSECQALISL